MSIERKESHIHINNSVDNSSRSRDFLLTNFLDCDLTSSIEKINIGPNESVILGTSKK